MSQPKEIPIVGDASLGWAFACSRKGASHRRGGQPCQDAYALGTGSGAGTSYIAVAVADGHGDDRHDLSHFGSTQAVRIAVEELVALYAYYGLDGKWTELTSSFKADIPRRITRRWREAVLEVENDRRRTAADGEATASELEYAPLIRYGTTLIVALVVGDVILVGQIGDGGIALVKGDGDVECLLANNPLEVGGTTDSLCSEEAPLRWRTTALERTGNRLLLLATDGLINAFPDEEQWRVFVHSLWQRISDFSPSNVASALPGWLDHYSDRASGDDITLAVALLQPTSIADRDPGSSADVDVKPDNRDLDPKEATEKTEDWELSS
jgi:serine/threonine protein phosphatase PrpC